MRLLVLVLTILAVLFIVSSAKAHVTRTPARCAKMSAPRLCSIHFHAGRTNTLRLAAHAPRLVYQWVAERHPARRASILTLWMHRQGHAERLLSRYQQSQGSTGGLPTAWLRAALCVHHYEGAWNADTGNGYYGGMQFSLSTWQSAGGVGMPNQASPSTQLRVAYHLWQRAGWNPWPTTARLCGLL